MAFAKVGNLKGAPAPASTDLTGITALVQGQPFVDVVFPASQGSISWVLIESRVFDTADAQPLNIWATIITQKSLTGFRQLLSAAPDSQKYYLLWTIRPAVASPGDATQFLMQGPATGQLNEPASFIVQLPAGKNVPAGNTAVTVTPHDGGAGGTFTPATVQLTNAAPNAAFTYTPTSYGNKTITATNDVGIANPMPIVFLASAETYTLVGPSSGISGQVSGFFTVSLPPAAALAANVIITPRSDAIDESVLNPFSPSSVILSAAMPSATFAYKANSGGVKNIATTNNAGLTDPPAVPYSAIAVFAPTDVPNLLRYWEGDMMAGWTDGQRSSGGVIPNYNGAPIGCYGNFRTGIANGKPVMRFASVNGGDRFWDNGGDLAGAQPFTLIAVLTQRPPAAAANIWATYGGQSIYINADGSLSMTAGASKWIGTPAGLMVSGFQTVAFVFNGANSKIFFNGALKVTGDASTGTIGWYNGPGGTMNTPYADCDVAGFVLYTAALTDQQVVGITYWFVNKYNTPAPST